MYKYAVQIKRGNMMHPGEMSRKEMNFSTKELLEKIKENRSKHAAEYIEAVKEYRAKLKSVLQKKMAEINKSEDTMVPKGTISVPEPKCYLSEYDQFIDMLEMTKDETTSLSITMFNQLVRDQWSWKQEFEMTKASYLM
jgi:polyhydroxyalkanoate synthesis regulator phasin